MKTIKTTLAQSEADRGKKYVALTSVLAAIFLTATKEIVGLLTGSLNLTELFGQYSLYGPGIP